MRVVSLFSGAGGLDLGFKMAGHEIVWADDLYEDAVETYRNNIGNHIVCRDIAEIKTEDIPECDIIIGGFPCQGFSVANMNRHVGDERNELYKQLLRVVGEKKPKFFMAENVKGIKNLDKGKIFEMILKDFAGIGYKVKHEVMNAADYGVPQTRQRVIIIGVREDVDFDYIFPVPTHDKEGRYDRNRWVSVGEAMSAIPNPDEPNDLPNHVYSKYKLQFNGYLGHRPLDPGKPAPTVTARGDNKGGVVILPHPNGQRRMSCREVAAVQSFPLDYEFADELVNLSNDIRDTSIGVDLARRTGERNLIRNSGQYWRALGLIEPGERSGKIKLTDFGRRVADHDISQAEFVAITVQTLKLPNPQVQGEEECKRWMEGGLALYPLKLLLEIECKLQEMGQGFLTTEELVRIIIPLSGCKAELQDYINFILWFRAGDISLAGWPDCCQGANDMRIAREYFLFLKNYGYVDCVPGGSRLEEKYEINELLLDEIRELIKTAPQEKSLSKALDVIRSTEITSEVERKRVQYSRTSRPNQANFRKEVLKACGRCIITNVIMPEILEAAHIKPFKYNGEDTVANGFALRTDIHTLFDTGHLRISVEGVIDLSTRARMDYGAAIPPRIVIPDFINREFLKWRWDNYNGL